VRAPPAHPPLAPAYAGPFKVLRRSPLTFQLQISDRTDTVSVHRLKPAYLPPDATPAQPPLRGRPPADPPRPPIHSVYVCTTEFINWIVVSIKVSLLTYLYPFSLPAFEISRSCRTASGYDCRLRGGWWVGLCMCQRVHWSYKQF
jgi:hypothetical protein